MKPQDLKAKIYHLEKQIEENILFANSLNSELQQLRIRLQHEQSYTERAKIYAESKEKKSELDSAEHKVTKLKDKLNELKKC